MYLDEPDYSPESLGEMITKNPALKEKNSGLKEVIKDFLTQLDDNGMVDWDREKDSNKIAAQIGLYAKLSGKLRGFVETEYINGRYEKSFSHIEAPARFTMLRYNLARGKALIHGRKNIGESDLELVKKVALSSCYTGRYRLITLLVDNNGEAETENIEIALGCSKGKALDVMEDMVTLGILIPFEKNLKSGGKTKCVRLRKIYRDLLLPRSS